MSPPLSAAQFVPLERKKQQLRARGEDPRALSRAHLVPSLVQFERHRLEAWQRAGEAKMGDLTDRCLILLGWEHGLEQLGQEHLMELGPGGAQLRRGPASPLAPSHAPLEPASVPRALERFFEWVRSPGFGELHALQQLTLSQMRLLEIYPFAGCLPAVALFSFFFLVDAGHPIPLYRRSDLGRLEQAMEQAFQLATEPLLAFHLEACGRAYDRLL